MKLPPVFGGGRRKIFSILAINGLAQAAITILISITFSRFFSESADAGHFQIILPSAILIAAMILVLLRAFERAQAEKLGQHYVIECRLELLTAISTLPARWNVASRYGLTMTRLITDLTSIKNWVSWGIAKLLVASISITGAIIALYIINRMLALMTLSTILFFVVVGAITSFFYLKQVRHVRKRRGRLAAIVGELAIAQGLAWHFGRLDREKKKIQRQSLRMADAIVKRGFISGYMRSYSEMIVPVSLTLTIFTISFLSDIQNISIATLVTSVFLISTAVAPVRDIMLGFEFYANFKVGKAKIENLLSKLTLDDPPANKEFEESRMPATIRLKEVQISPFQSNCTASLKSGEIVLLTGPSGSGKTALIQAIAGLSIGSDGNPGVLLDGRSQTAVSSRSWHRRVKLVSPDLPLLKSSLSRNIRYGNSTLDREKLDRISSLCGIPGNIAQLSLTLSTKIQEVGRNLPSGLKSRISLARAIAANPGIILIDDPNFIIDPDCVESLRNVTDEVSASFLVTSSRYAQILPWTQIWRIREGSIVSCPIERRPDSPDCSEVIMLDEFLSY